MLPFGPTEDSLPCSGATRGKLFCLPLRTIKAGVRRRCNTRLMICCLFIAALLAPLGLWVKPATNGSDAICCADRRTAAFVAAAGLLIAAACLLILTLPQNAPFHHLCRFITAPG